MNTIVELYRANFARHQWRWRLRDARNRKIIGASTESYRDRAQAIRNLLRVTGIALPTEKVARPFYSYSVDPRSRMVVFFTRAHQ